MIVLLSARWVAALVALPQNSCRQKLHFIILFLLVLPSPTIEMCHFQLGFINCWDIGNKQVPNKFRNTIGWLLHLSRFGSHSKKMRVFNTLGANTRIFSTKNVQYAYFATLVYGIPDHKLWKLIPIVLLVEATKMKEAVVLFMLKYVCWFVYLKFNHVIC